jgi:hypothetical protein
MWARTDALSARFSGGLCKRVQEVPHASPVTERLSRIVSAHPLGRPPMPLRRFPSVARLLPVVREECRTLAELPRPELLDRARNRAVDAGSTLRELRTVGDFLGQGVGAEVESSPSEPETLLRNRKALAEPPSIKIGRGQAVPNGLSSRCPPSRRPAESTRGAGPRPPRRPQHTAGYCRSRSGPG